MSHERAGTPAGAVAWLPKPFVPEVLLQTLEKHLRRE